MDKLYSEIEMIKIRGDAYLKGIDYGRKAVIEEALMLYAEKKLNMNDNDFRKVIGEDE